VASGENAIIEGKIALIIVTIPIKDNDCYIHLYYLNIFRSSGEIDISHFQNPFGKSNDSFR
jgi:hypothetical protein